MYACKDIGRSVSTGNPGETAGPEAPREENSLAPMITRTFASIGHGNPLTETGRGWVTKRRHEEDSKWIENN